MKMANKRKKLPIGTSDFEKLRRQDLYYVDKSLLAEEVIKDAGRVILLPRPRRFGKTLNLTMLRYFFDCVTDYSALFKGLAITQTDTWQQHQGQYPVVFISLSNCKGSNWPLMKQQLAKAVSDMCSPHEYLLNDERVWTGNSQKKFIALLRKEADMPTMSYSLKMLVELLYQYHNRSVVVLVDGYDSGLIHAYTNDFYSHMNHFAWVLLASSLKDSPYLHKALMAGEFWISPNSFFDSFNNYVAKTVLNQMYADKFGFTMKEVAGILNDFNQPHTPEQVNQWYGGHQFGGRQMANPSSIINYLSLPQKTLRPMACGSSLLTAQLERARLGTITRLETLMRHESVETTLDVHLDLKDLPHPHQSALFSFLTFSGYLNATLSRQVVTKRYYTLRIPNLEVLSVYQTIFKRYFIKTIEIDNAHTLLNSLLNGNFDLFGQHLQAYVLKAFSYHDLPDDTPERVYHSFMMGTLGFLFFTHTITSNREMGLGRADMVIVPKDAADRRAYVLEFKKATSPEALNATAQEALQQIDQRQYTAQLQAEARHLYRLGIAFHGKQLALAHQV